MHSADPPHPTGQIVWAGLALTAATEPTRSNYALYVQEGQIVDAGPHHELTARYPAAPQVGGAHLLLMPGLINSHDHGRGLSGVALGVPDDLLEIWLLGLATLPALDPRLLAQLEGALLLRSGVTATAHSHNPATWASLPAECEPTLAGYRDAGIRVAFHPPYVDQNSLIYAGQAEFLASLPPSLRPIAESWMQPPTLSREDYFTLCTQLYNRFHDPLHHTVHIQISPAGGPWCSDELLLAAQEWAVPRQTRVQIHLLETRYQALYARRRWGSSFVAHLDSLGLLGPWLTLAHMVWSDPDDVERLRAAKIAIAHNPSSNLRLRSGVAPVAAYLAANLPLGIGMDGYTLDDDQDYLRELRLAWTLANRPGAGSPTVPASAILQMGLAGGAAVTFGPEVPLGHLHPGALADLVLLDWHAIEGIWAAPTANPLDLLLRRANRTHVQHVLVAGRWVVRDGRTTTLDETTLKNHLHDLLATQPPPKNTARLQAEIAHLAPAIRHFYSTWDRENDVNSDLR